jgi:homoserine kinase type II
VNPPADVDAILDGWALPRPRTVAPAARGYQNTTLFVSCASGDYVLKMYSNVAELAHRRFEHELLARLVLADLPFAVPRIVPDAEGDTLHSLDGRPAALFGRIEGEALPKDGGAYVRPAAAALARLDAVMAELDHFGHRPPRFEGDFGRVHPLVDDIAEAIKDSGLDASQTTLLHRALDRASELAAPVYASLPRQVTHGDFAFGNTLVKDGVVTGLVDFEHAGIDVRAMDLAAALYRFPAHWDSLGECERFGRAYCAVLPLDVIEVAALPALLLVRSGVFVAHWVGRYRAGLATIDEVRPRAARALFTAEWVEDNGAELVHRALGWVGDRV